MSKVLVPAHVSVGFRMVVINRMRRAYNASEEWFRWIHKILCD